MPTPDLIQGTDLPIYADDAAIPDHLAAIFYALLARGIPRFATMDQLRAAYPAPADLQFAGVTAENAVYVRAGGQWRVLWRQGMAPQVQYGRVTIDVSSVASQGNSAATPVTFPVPFAGTPHIPGLALRDSNRPIVAFSTGASATGFSIIAKNVGTVALPAATTITVDWMAVAG